MGNSHDREVLRRLAERKYAIGQQPRQMATLELWADLNDLRPCRPLVWINEIPWHELEAADPEALRVRCEDPFLREVEGGLRRELYQWEHFPGDMVVEPCLYVSLVGGPTSSYGDYGIVEQVRSSPGAADVVFLPVLHTEEDVDRIRAPHVGYDRAETERRVACLAEILEGVMPVRRRGIVHQWHAPWDQIIHWYGIEQMYVDMIEKPDLVRRVIRNFCRALTEVLDRQQALGMLDAGNGNWRVGSGGMGCSRALAERVEGRAATPGDQWGCSNAQIFSEVSPAMHEEFSLVYERPLLARFGLTYYGCCEPLHHKVKLMRTIPNLRKISISPKARIRQAAEAIGRDYVLSIKPNPAELATDVFDAEAVRASLRETLAATAGLAVEIILKDISTIRGDARRLDQWAAIAKDAVANP